MKLRMDRCGLRLWFVTFCLMWTSSLRAEAQIAVRGGTVYTMAGDAIPDGVVLIRDGKIHEMREYFDTMHANDVLCSAPAPGFNQ